MNQSENYREAIIQKPCHKSCWKWNLAPVDCNSFRGNEDEKIFIVDIHHYTWGAAHI